MAGQMPNSSLKQDMAELLEASTTQIPSETKTSQRIVYPIATWLALRKDYIQGGGTLEAMCFKHGINYLSATKRAWEQDWTGQRKIWTERSRAAILPPEPIKEQTPPQPAIDAPQTKLGKVEAQLVQIDMMIDDCQDAKQINSLVQAKERLLNAWSLLTGFERPGIRRNKSKRSSYQSAQPIEPDQPSPVPVQPAKPMGWEYD